jgi:hypothetical protein
MFFENSPYCVPAPQSKIYFMYFNSSAGRQYYYLQVIKMDGTFFDRPVSMPSLKWTLCDFFEFYRQVLYHGTKRQNK